MSSTTRHFAVPSPSLLRISLQLHNFRVLATISQDYTFLSPYISFTRVYSDCLSSAMMYHFITGLLSAMLLVNFVSQSSGAAITLDPVVVTPRSKEVEALSLASDLDTPSEWRPLKGDSLGAVPRRPSDVELFTIRPTLSIECKRLCPAGFLLTDDCQCVYPCPVLRCAQDCETYELDIHGCKTCRCHQWSVYLEDEDCYESVSKYENTRAIIRRDIPIAIERTPEIYSRVARDINIKVSQRTVGSMQMCVNACFEDKNCVACQYFGGNQFLNREASCDLHYTDYPTEPAKGYDYYIFHRCPKKTTATITDKTTPYTVETRPTTEATKPTIHFTKPTINITRPTIEITRPTIEVTTAPTKETRPTTLPTEPTTEKTKPTTERTEPTTLPTKPTTERTKPTTERTKPTTLVTKPTTERTKPTTLPTKPTTERTKPTTERTKPTTEKTTPIYLPTTPERPTTVLPTEPICLDSRRGDSCVGVANGNYQDCYKCNGFVMCSNRLLHFQVCPAGLVWDDVVKRCEWETTTCFPRDEAPPTPTPEVQEPFGCRRRCEASEHGQYMQSCRGCQAYAICIWGTLIDMETMVCPGNAEWDDHYNVCVQPPSSTCRLVPARPQ